LPQPLENLLRLVYNRFKWIWTKDGGWAKFDGQNWTVYNCGKSHYKSAAPGGGRSLITRRILHESLEEVVCYGFPWQRVVGLYQS
jgi:hypothetical protein